MLFEISPIIVILLIIVIINLPEKKSTIVSDKINYEKLDKLIRKDIIDAMSKERIYFVYKYTFKNGRTYYGRTNSLTNEYGNRNFCNSKKALKMMIDNPTFIKEKIFENYNLLLVARKEQQLIEADYKKCYNKLIYQCEEKVYKELLNRYKADGEK